MRHLPSSRQILGTPFWLLAMPMCFAGWLANRHKERVMPCTPHGLEPHEWMRVHWCSTCQDDMDHSYKEFRDEPVVTKECHGCGVVTEHWDRV